MKRKRRKEFDRNVLPTGAELAQASGEPDEKCEHCGQPKRLHPIPNPKFPKKYKWRPGRVEANKQYLCALDYTVREATPLPFGLRDLDDKDKRELQVYWNDTGQR